MEIIDAIKKVIPFAGGEKTGLWQNVCFRPGEVTAQTPSGGARAVADVDLNCSVAAKDLSKALRAVGGVPTLSVEQHKLVLRSGGARVSLAMSADDGPSFPSTPKEWIECSGFDQIARVSWGCSSDETRQHLNGVFLGPRGMESCNGHVAVQFSGVDYLSLLGSTVLVPSKMESVLTGSKFVSHAVGRRLFCSEGNTENFAFCQLLQESFPPTSNFFDQHESSPSALVNRCDLQDLVRRARTGASILGMRVGGGRLTVDSEAGVTNCRFDFFDSVALRECAIPDVVFGISADYLLDMLKHSVGEDVLIRTEGSLSPLIVEDGSLRCVIMPCRL